MSDLKRALYNGRKPAPGSIEQHATEVLKAASAHLVAQGPCDEVADVDSIVCGDPDCTYCDLVAAFESVAAKP